MAATTTPVVDQLIRSFSQAHSTMHANGRDLVDRSIRTCQEMLHDRGCTKIVVDSIEQVMESPIPLPVVKGRGGLVDIDVFFHAEDRIGIKYARTVLDQPGNSLKIIVSCDGPTPFARKECDCKDVQFMQVKHICVNKTLHELVPKHEVVDLPPVGIDVKHLPRILESDPIVRYYGWPTGTIVKIMRKFGGHEEIPYFRVVSAVSN